MKIYIASSWSNQRWLNLFAQDLRNSGFEVDCFCDPSTGRFVNPKTDKYNNDNIPSFLKRPEVRDIFIENVKYVDWCDAVILVLPSGRSAHLEAGYAIGNKKPVFIVQIDNWITGEMDAMYYWASEIISTSEDCWFNELMYSLSTVKIEHTPKSIEDLYKLQDKLWEKVQKRFPNLPRTLTNVGDYKEKIEWTKTFLMCIIAECTEILEWLPWKHWGQQDKPLTVERMTEIQMEIIDIMHFLINLSKIWEMNPNQFNFMFKMKHEINIKRQENNY